MQNNEKRSSRWILWLKGLLITDMPWKLFSLVVAIFAWILVMNTINPTEIKSFNTVLSFENMDYLIDRGYVVSNLDQIENMPVTVKVEATRPALDDLSRAAGKSGIKAKIDLSKVDLNTEGDFPRTVSAGITPVLPNNVYGNNYEISSYYPTACDVEIDRAKSKNVEVELRSTGSPAVGYSIGKPTSSVTRVNVIGAESKVSQVERAVAVIDVSAEKSDISKNCSLAAYDGDGNALVGFIIEPETIPVSISIRRNTTVAIDPPETTGVLPAHLELGTIDYSPKEVNVTTSSSEVPESIALPPVDINNITETTSYVVDIADLLANAGLEPVDGSQSRISVTVNVSLKESKKYEIPSSAIALRGLAQGLNATLPDSVSVDIGGADVDVASLQPFVDLTGLGEGEHEVPLKLTIPQGSALKEEPNIEVSIKSSESIDVPEETVQQEEEESTKQKEQE